MLWLALGGCAEEGQVRGVEPEDDDRYACGTGSGGGTGSSSSSCSDSETDTDDEPVECCQCEFQPESAGGVPGDEQRCNDWIANHSPACSVSSVTPVSPGSLGPACSVSDDCDQIDYQYYGHGNGDLGDDFIDHVVTLCLSCSNVDASLSGCQLFQNGQAAQNYLNSLNLPSCVSLSMTGSQCLVPVGSEACMPGACTLSYGCDGPAYAPCSQTEGNTCYAYEAGNSVTCTDGDGICSAPVQLSCCGSCGTGYAWQRGGCDDDSGSGSGSGSGSCSGSGA